MLHSWQRNPEGVPAAIRQEDDSSLNLSDVDIWMWLKRITPSKGVMMRQRLMPLFGEAGQWASLVDTCKLPEQHGSELCNSTRTEYKFMSLLTADMSLRDLALWLGKYAGVTTTCVARVEEYTTRVLAKMVHSSTSRLGKRLHETARTKDRLDHRKRWLLESTKLDSDLSVIAPTSQPSAMTSMVIAFPSLDNKEGTTETRPVPAPYNDGNVLMGNVEDSVTDDLYQGGWL